MDRFLQQFRRIYADNGSGDVDFTKKEEELRISQNKLKQATQELVKAAENLNTIALGVDDKKQVH
jgi:hypothetical protein